MTDDTNHRHGLSRRRVLGGLGAIGVASAGAGIGTTAYFSDEESFEENSLTAGELDLKLDYKATYAGGPGRLEEINGWYSEDGPGEPFDVEEVEDGTYLIGEVPDVDSGDLWEDEVQNTDLCAADLGLINGDEIPVFTLEDVKPGDSGEVTVSLHICDNPAWMYMNGELTANDENTVTEPEASSNDENNDISDSEIEGDGELADAIQTKLWYDENCNNVHDGGGQEQRDRPLCIQLVIDSSGSIGSSTMADVRSAAKEFAGQFLPEDEGEETDNMVGVVDFESSADPVQSLTDSLSDVESAIDGLTSGGSTNIANGINVGQSGDDGESGLLDCPGGKDRIMVVFTDGQDSSDSTGEGDAAKAAGTTIYAIGVGGADMEQLEGFVGEGYDSSSGEEEPEIDPQNYIFPGTGETSIDQLFSQVSETIAGDETVIKEGSLAETMAALENGIALDGDRSSEEMDPFVGGMTHCLGFEWELPEDVGNEVQTDSVGFDLGFYALQSRHNDQPPANPFDGNFTDDNGLPSGGNSTNATN
ncbi:vWA domain-containing protein [Halopenitus persicus]|uniref:SipW-cognate class signal peptide n=1 Tax=Halopenitus persicus TaxID=1048396 RepID=A0A1H3M0L7_9EURY|nr:VWA domain-containing protein [Halopenitus persicus]SDY70113.1 SipW-cognate class signal peptide [Halopenitus persicus]